MDVNLELLRIIESQEDGSLKMLINSTGMNFTFWSYSLIRDTAKKAQSKIDKSCYVGVNRYSKTIYSVYKRFTGSNAQFFDTLEEGLEYISTKD